MGTAPTIYVYFKKLPVDLLEVGPYGDFAGRSRQDLYQVDHLPSQVAVIIYLKAKYPDMDKDEINEIVKRVAAVAIPIKVHQKCSGTYGQRNSTMIDMGNGEMISRKHLDAKDLEAAVNSNWDANAKCLKSEHGVSDERIEEIRNDNEKKRA